MTDELSFSSNDFILMLDEISELEIRLVWTPSF